MCSRSQPQLEVPMGKVVALSSFELNCRSERETRRNRGTAEVILFTGVRYERMGNLEELHGFENEEALPKNGLPASSK